MEKGAKPSFKDTTGKNAYDYLKDAPKNGTEGDTLEEYLEDFKDVFDKILTVIRSYNEKNKDQCLRNFKKFQSKLPSEEQVCFF